MPKTRTKTKQSLSWTYRFWLYFCTDSSVDYKSSNSGLYLLVRSLFSTCFYRPGWDLGPFPIYTWWDFAPFHAFLASLDFQTPAAQLFRLTVLLSMPIISLDLWTSTSLDFKVLEMENHVSFIHLHFPGRYAVSETPRSAQSVFFKFHQLKRNLLLGCWTLPHPLNFEQAQLCSENSQNSEHIHILHSTKTSAWPWVHFGHPGSRIWLSAPILPLGHYALVVILSEEFLNNCVTRNRKIRYHESSNFM